MTLSRIDRILSSRGLGTRKDIQRLLKAGRISVDGVIVRKKDCKISQNARIEMDGTIVHALPFLVLWHKPLGVVCTLRDPLGRRDLSAVMPFEWRAHFHPVGRLDQETTGLLLFSRSGALTQWLLHPRRGVERRYRAHVDGTPSSTLIETLAAGVETSLGRFPARVDSMNGHVIELTVQEGKHRMVRRILANVGHPVIHLHRLTYGPCTLGNLPVEEWRAIDEAELSALHGSGAPIPEISGQ